MIELTAAAQRAKTQVIPPVASADVSREGTFTYPLIALRCAVAKSRNMKAERYAVSGCGSSGFSYTNAAPERSASAIMHGS